MPVSPSIPPEAEPGTKIHTQILNSSGEGIPRRESETAPGDGGLSVECVSRLATTVAPGACSYWGNRQPVLTRGKGAGRGLPLQGVNSLVLLATGMTASGFQRPENVLRQNHLSELTLESWAGSGHGGAGRGQH